jgi:hypothetical protein
MLCALTVRELTPDAMEQFKQAFVPDDDMPPTSLSSRSARTASSR